jgi:GAF domain-containing protein
MTVVLEELRDEIRREEVGAGLSTERPLTRADIERRRRQIAQVGLVVFFGVVVSTLHANVWGNTPGRVIDPNLLRAATITAAGGFIAYVVEKERHLRRLVLLEGEERSVQLAIADRLLEAAAFADASSSVQASLVLERVLEQTLDRVSDLVGAESASIRLLSADGQLRVAAMRGPSGTPALLGGVALATRVGLAHEPMLLPGVTGRHDPERGLVIGAPLMLGEQLLGVLQLGARPDEPFGAIDLEIVAGFTERVALALHHSRLYEDALVALGTARAPA